MKFHKIEGSKPSSGHYTPAVSANGFLFISGQVPVEPITGEKYSGGIEEQFMGILNNLKRLLEDSGSNLDNVVKVNIYVPDAENWGIVNEIYSKFFGKHKPARAIIPCGKLHKGYLLELEAIAILKDN